MQQYIDKFMISNYEQINVNTQILQDVLKNLEINTL